MSVAFADTFFFLALLNPADASHKAALHASSEPSFRFVTSGWIFLEIADGLASRPHRRQVASLISRIRGDRRHRVIECAQADFDAAMSLYDARFDKEWSLTDCTSFVIMRKLRLREALTGDHHFEQAGFKAIFRRDGRRRNG